MDFITFTLVGLFTGAMGGWAAFAFGTKTGKVIAGSASLGAVALETDSALQGFISYGHDSGELVLALTGTYVLGFIATLALLTQLLLKQDSKYRITLIDVVFGNNKALDAYHEAKRLELDSLLERELNVQALQQERQALAARKQQLDDQHQVLRQDLAEAAAVLQARDEFVSGQLFITLARKHKLPIKPLFFELLPRYVHKACLFHHGLQTETARYLADARTSAGNRDVFDAYLMSVAGCIKQHLFDQSGPSGNDEVRVHFRKLDLQDFHYKAHVVHGQQGGELTPIPADSGLIKASRDSGRSLVHSVNKKAAFNTGSGHRWQDYLTYVVEHIVEDGEPVYSLGISVRHSAVHTSLLYFLSFTQWEHGLQQALMKVHGALSV